jgi:hypothetical protein
MKVHLNECLAKVEAAYPGNRDTAKLILAAAAATLLKRSHPLSLILVGQPSSGKTSLLMPLTKAKKDSSLHDRILRVDEFTPASLVTHASQKDEKSLSKIDLLPKMKGRCVINKEMAPLFSGHEEDVAKRFAVMASVLDGEGYVSSSGNHGMRGYPDPIVFTLIGAVTPKVLTPKVVDAMNSIGPRLCFWNMPERSAGFTWKGPSKNRPKLEREAQSEMQEFLEALFSKNKAESISIEEFILPEELKCQLAAISVLMSHLRATVRRSKGEVDDVETLDISQEAPERSFSYLHQVACALALIEGRRDIQIQDLLFPLRIALSSGRSERVKIMKLLFNSTSPRSHQDFMYYLDLSDDTVRKRVGLLTTLQLVRLVSDNKTHLYDLVEALSDVRTALEGYGPI